MPEYEHKMVEGVGEVLRVKESSIGTDYRNPDTGVINWKGLKENLQIDREVVLVPFDQTKTDEQEKAKMRAEIEIQLRAEMDVKIEKIVKEALALQAVNAADAPKVLKKRGGRPSKKAEEVK